MYHVLSESDNGNFGIKIDGKLTKNDYELLIPYINQVRQDLRTLNLLFDMTACEGLDSQALWQELTSQLHHIPDIPRIAVIGDRHWMKCGTKVFHPLHKTLVMFFGSDQEQEAWEWVKTSDG